MKFQIAKRCYNIGSLIPNFTARIILTAFIISVLLLVILTFFPQVFFGEEGVCKSELRKEVLGVINDALAPTPTLRIRDFTIGNCVEKLKFEKMKDGEYNIIAVYNNKDEETIFPPENEKDKRTGIVYDTNLLGFGCQASCELTKGTYQAEISFLNVRFLGKIEKKES